MESFTVEVNHVVGVSGKDLLSYLGMGRTCSRTV